MKKTLIVLGILLILGGTGYFGIMKRSSEKANLSSQEKYGMNIKSEAFKNGEQIPKKFTCDGENINPPLSISGTPKNTKSLVLIVDDPDATVGLWVHWTLWNVGSNLEKIGEHSVPEGAVEGKTSFGKPGWGGPCPPVRALRVGGPDGLPGQGEHHYYFKIYALDVELDLSLESDKEVLEEAMVGHVLDKAELIGLYERGK